jgi:hypothetical protein
MIAQDPALFAMSQAMLNGGDMSGVKMLNP